MHKISNSHTLHRKISPACRKKHGVIMRKSLGSPRDIRFQNTYLKNEIKKNTTNTGCKANPKEAKSWHLGMI